MKDETAPPSKSSPTFVEPTVIQVGQLIDGRYEVLAFLGEGGMGIAYKARDIELKRIVALKFLLPHRLGSRKDISRFEREANTAIRLLHPGIAKVFDLAGLRKDQPFLVMEFLEGQTLAQYIATKGQLPLDETLDIFIQICEALAYAHANGILHRDIKPSNVMLTSDGASLRVKLLDFGMARLMTAEEIVSQQITETGELVGSPLYMSPEQARNATLDARSDLYSLGCTLYEALTGGPPHLGQTSLATILKRETDRPLALSEASFGRHFSESLELLVSRLLKTDPADRFQSADQVMQELKRIKADGFITTKTSDQKQPGQADLPTKRIHYSLLAYVLLLPVCLVVFSLAVGGLFLSRTNQAKLRAKAAAQKEVKTAQPSDEASRKILDRLKAADLTSMGTLLLNRNKSEEAFSAFNDAIHIYEHDPQPPIDQYTEALFGLAYCYQQAGNSIESVKYANRGLNITENVDGDLSPTLAFQLTFVGSSLLARGGRDADATFQVIKPFYERSLSIAAKIHKPGSTYLADLLSIQGRSCFTRNLLSEALPRLEKAELLYRAAAPKEVSEDTQLPSVINYLAQGYCQTKQYDKIPPICREMTSVYNSYDGKLKTKSAGLLLSTAELLRSCSIKTKNPLNAFRIAEHACQAVLPAYRASTDTERHALANLYETLGTVCCEEASLGGKEGHKSAEHWFREAIATRKAMAKPETLELARNIRSLGTVLAGQHKYSDARPLIDQGLYLSRKLSGSNSHDSAISLGCSAELYRAQGDFAKAEPLYTQAMRLCMQAPQSDTLEVAMIYAGLAACKRENGRDAEAIPLFDHARKIYLAKLGPRSLNFIWADTELKAVQAKLKGKKTSNQNRTDRELHG